MNAAAERALLSRADDLADTTGLAEQVVEVIGWARAARVDPGALGGLVTAARLLGAGTGAVFRAMRGGGTGGAFTRDTELLDAAAGIEASITGLERDAGELQRRAETALARARAAEILAAAQLARARMMPVTRPCRGCHPAREQAIAAAQRDLDDTRERRDCATATLEILGPLKRRLAGALRAVRRLPEDLQEVYAAVYDLVTVDAKAMPADGDFLTGETTAAGMAARLLAAWGG